MTDPARSGRSWLRGVPWLVTTLVACVATYAWAREAGTPPAPGDDAPAQTERTVVVRQRRLSDAVIVRGTVAARESIGPDFGAGSGDGSDPVVTGTPLSRGDTVQAGAAVLEVAGRPVLALQGSVPSYRDLTPGMSGPDVVQLRAALTQLGHPSDDPAGAYGPSTADAVAAAFASAGYSPPDPPDGAEAEARSADDAVRAAERALRESRSGPEGDSLVEATVGLSAATRQAAAAESAAVEDVELARTKVATALTEVAAASADDLPMAKAGLAEAQAQLASVTRSTSEALASARDQLVLSRARLTTLSSGPDADAVAEATADLDAASARAALAQLAAATPLPRSEVLFVEAFPSVVSEVDVVVGDRLDAEHVGVAISRGAPGVSLDLTPQAARLVHAGMRAEVEDARAGTTFAATVADEPDLTAAQGDTVTVFLDAVDPLDPALVGRDVKVTIELAATPDAVLAAPLTAVRSSGDGTSRVEVVGRDGRTREVDVTTGATIDGWVELVDPPADLHDGTELRVR